MDNINDFYDYLAIVSTLFSITAFIIGLACIKSIKGYLVPLFLYVSVSVVVEIINFILARLNTNNLYVFHFFSIIEFILLSLFYGLFFSKHIKRAYLLLPIPFFLIIAYVDYKINGLKSMDNFSASTESILLSVYALLSFQFIMRKLIFENILSAPFFWINSGILFYFAGNLLFCVFSNYIYTTEYYNYNALCSISAYLNILYNIFIGIGFWKTRAK